MSGPREEAVFCELPGLGTIAFGGPDAASFLHNQLTCDVAGLAPGRSTYGAYCNPKGRMLASFLLWRSGPEFLMQLPAELVAPTCAELARFVLRAKVTMRDVSGRYAGFGIAGPGAKRVLERCCGERPRSEHAVLEREEGALVALPGGRYQWIIAAERAGALAPALEAEARRAPPEYWSWLEIRSGIPTVTAATRGEFVPQMANLDLLGAVSLSKGCYPGQEIIARMHYRGTLKQRLYLAHLPGEQRPRPGERLYSPLTGEQSCGMVVNAAATPQGGHDLLAVLQIAAAGSGEIRWKSPDGPPLRLLALPYGVPPAA